MRAMVLECRDEPADDADVIAWGRSFRAALRDHTTGVTYLNFTGDEGAARVRAQYRPGAYERLARIKAEWDPDDVFRAVGSVAVERPSTDVR